LRGYSRLRSRRATAGAAQTPLRAQERVERACHEAGHAAAAIALGVGVALRPSM
jgi:hypothetical protein